MILFTAKMQNSTILISVLIALFSTSVLCVPLSYRQSYGPNDAMGSYGMGGYGGYGSSMGPLGAGYGIMGYPGMGIGGQFGMGISPISPMGAYGMGSSFGSPLSSGLGPYGSLGAFGSPLGGLGGSPYFKL